MNISSRTEGQIQILLVEEPRIDASAALAFKEKVRETTQNAPVNVVLDLRQVTFIDSSGLGAIVAMLKHLAPERKLALAEMTPPVQRVFQLTRMDQVLPIFATLEDARETCGA